MQLSAEETLYCKPANYTGVAAAAAAGSARFKVVCVQMCLIAFCVCLYFCVLYVCFSGTILHMVCVCVCACTSIY